MSARRPTRDARRAASAVAAGALCLVLAACGSQLDPNDVVTAGGTVGGTTVGGTGVVGDDGTVVGGDPGAGGVPGTDGSSGTSGSSGSSGSTGGTDSGGGSGSTTDPGGASSADGGGKAASCDGFKNGPGITDSTITIGNASDISGPVPGLFEAAQDATKAYVAFYNKSNPDGICGRSLVLKNYDSRTDAGADQQAYADGCENVFAMVGSMSAFDSGGASAAEGCGLPDIRSASVTKARSACKTCFGAQSTVANQFQNAVPDYVLKNFKAASQKGAMLYVNAGAAVENGKLQMQAMTQRGMKFVYEQAIEVSDFNYAPYVQQLKDRGVGYVQFIGAASQAVKLAQAMEQQSYEPDIYMLDPTAYTSEYLSGGAAVEGTTLFTNFVPFEEASSNQETQLYTSWLQQVKPGAKPTFFGAFAWSAARLFVQEATGLGGQLNRGTLVASLNKVSDWTANGLHSKQQVGPRQTGECWRFLTVKGGKFVAQGSRSYTCNGITTVR
ncbi:hypothetical protein I601_1861 [Nocardioides dokdonensis FR1436]|uniref:Leucine-binding protein domain-containing protein n=1 Tax=Nocardioides dokdonensis FR1436 TaxID=1300347 RepID=A0A1A9GKV9_9ACTN|nr:ABC transporter substrate-binding protein [Nocardioides dokdonensis]ANH38292.1 hypothetical protein I601_1861 [Nocardioides dokdonensis FR1436]